MLIACLLVAALQSIEADSVLDPTTWTSPSGVYALSVDPSDRGGKGPAGYVLKCRGVDVWSAELPFTLWRLALTDDGAAIGYAYTGGINSAGGELQAIRIDASGSARVFRRTDRHFSREVHGGMTPRAHQILLQPATDRAMIGVEEDSWYFRISDGERLQPFRIDGDRLSWDESRPVTPATDEGVPRVAGTLDLREAGSFTFDRPAEAETGIHDVPDFRIDDRGRFGWVRITEKADGWELVLFGVDGVRAARVDLGDLRRSGQPGGAERPRSIWLAGDAWLVTVYVPGPPLPRRGSLTEFREPGSTCAWIVDSASSVVREVKTFRCPEIWDIAPLPNGGVVALVNRRDVGKSESTVLAFDGELNPVWKVQSTTDLEDRSRLVAPGRLVATSDGRVVVHDGVRRLLQVFDGRGGFLTSVDLGHAQTVWPSALTWLAADRDGGLLAGVSNGSTAVLEIGRTGELERRFVPRRSDGTLLFGNRLERAPDGRLWTREADALLRLTEDGLADLAVGDPHRTERTAHARVVEVDLAGRIYSADRATGVVRVYDSTGALLHTCTPSPADFESPVRPFWICPDGRGGVHVVPWLRRYPEPVRSLAFAPDGRRLGWTFCDIGPGHGDMRFVPGTGRRWVAGFDELFLVGDSGHLEGTVDRQPDRCWLRSLGGFAVAPDGSVAVLSKRGSLKIACLYDSGGRPIRSFALPGDASEWRPSVVWTGRWLFVPRDDGEFHVIDSRTGERRSFRLDGPRAGDRSGLFLSAGGREIWFADVEARRVQRFSLPGD